MAMVRWKRQAIFYLLALLVLRGLDQPNHEVRSVAVKNVSTKEREEDICQQRFSDNHMPTIYLHGGPWKTGTTSLQNYFACHQFDLLNEHNISFLGKVNRKDVANCQGVPLDFVRGMVQHKSIKGMWILLQGVKSNIQQGRDVIISDEDLMTVPHLIERFIHELDVFIRRETNNTQTFRVVPVLAYRRYHQWMVSWYEFSNKPVRYNRKYWNHWRDMVVPSFSEFFQDWSNKSGHPSLELLRVLQDSVAKGLTTSTTNAAERGGGRLCPPLVLNMHKNPSDVVSDFVDFALRNRPQSNHTTASLKAPPSRVNNVNPGVPFAVDSEVLALHLKRHGHLHDKFQRRAMVRFLQTKMVHFYNNANATTPPWDCLNVTQQEAFLNAAVNAERALLPANFCDSSMGVEALVKHFQQASANKVFCSLAPQKMLQQPEWQPILKCLKNGDLNC